MLCEGAGESTPGAFVFAESSVCAEELLAVVLGDRLGTGVGSKMALGGSALLGGEGAGAGNGAGNGAGTVVAAGGANGFMVKPMLATL